MGIHDDDLAAAGADGLRLPGELLLGDMLEPHVQRQVKVRSARPPRLRVRAEPHGPAVRVAYPGGAQRLPRQDAVVLVLQPSQALLVDAGVADCGARRHPSRIHAAHLLPDVDAREFHGFECCRLCGRYLARQPDEGGVGSEPALEAAAGKGMGRRWRFSAPWRWALSRRAMSRRTEGAGMLAASTLSWRSKMRPRSGDTVNHPWFCCAAESRQ